jgi:hypothetical protein
MITLTTPAEINSVLGGNTPVAYNKLVLSPFTMNAVDQTIQGTLRLTSTGTPSMQPITGTLRMSVTSSELLIEVPQLDFYRRIVLTSPQNTAVLSQIESAQAAVENGLVTIGVIAGTRTSGA